MIKFLFWFVQVLAAIAEYIVFMTVAPNSEQAGIHGQMNFPAVVILLFVQVLAFFGYFIFNRDGQRENRRYLVASALCSLGVGLLGTFIGTFFIGSAAYSILGLGQLFLGVFAFAICWVLIVLAIVDHLFCSNTLFD